MSGFIWLASYPKSGSTWLRLALESLAQSGAPVRLNDERGRAGLGSLRDMFEDVLCVDTSDLSADEIDELRPRCYEIIGRETEPPKILKVHDAWTLTKAGVPLFPRAATAGAIYLVRDPRDVAVSCAYHEGIAFDVQIERMATADYRASVSVKSLRRQVPQHFFSWSAHVQSWLEAPELRLLQVRYEDMVDDFAAQLRRIAAFLGLPETEDAIAGAVAATRFEVLQQAEMAEGFGERPRTAKLFFRKGVAGGWQQELTPEQAARIERDHGAVMRRLGYCAPSHTL